MANTGTINLPKGLQADMYKWGFEGTAEYYKKYPPIYSKIAKMKNVSEIKGAFEQVTNAIGMSELDERVEGAPITEKTITEGFTVYGAKKNKANKVAIPYELKRDWHRKEAGLASFLEGYMKNEMPGVVATTYERILAKVFLDGGKTAGATIFDNSTRNNTPSYGDLVYDSKPFFALSGNDRTAKNGSTYYNAVALNLTSEDGYDNLDTMNTLLTATNAKMENGVEFDQTRNKCLVVPTQLSSMARRILKAEKVAGVADNDFNALAGEFEIIVNPFLNSAPTAFYMGIKNEGIWYYTSDPKINFYVDHETEDLKANILLDYCIFVQNWRPWVSSNAAAS